MGVWKPYSHQWYIVNWLSSNVFCVVEMFCNIKHDNSYNDIIIMKTEHCTAKHIISHLVRYTSTSLCTWSDTVDIIQYWSPTGNWLGYTIHTWGELIHYTTCYNVNILAVDCVCTRWFIIVIVLCVWLPLLVRWFHCLGHVTVMWQRGGMAWC